MVLMLLLIAPGFASEAGVRIKDLCDIEGVRDNQLNGVGVVVGLAGSGDDKDAVLTAMRSYLLRNRLQIDRSYRGVKGKNIALVVVTAKLPPFIKSGSRIDCQVSAIGDAKSLKGGVLLQTLLVGFDGNVYAAAQGSVSIGGYGNAGPGQVSTGLPHTNVETTGTVAGGAIVEAEVPMEMVFEDHLRLALKQPDFTNANRVARVLAAEFGDERVSANDAASVTLRFDIMPPGDGLIQIIARIEELRVQPDSKARVVINERTGTVVVGRDVRIDPVAVSHAGLSLQVRPATLERTDPEDPERTIRQTTWQHPMMTDAAMQPPEGVRVDRDDIPGSVTVLDGSTVEAISNALNAIGARPTDMVAIFQAIHRAGALHAELVVM